MVSYPEMWLLQVPDSSKFFINSICHFVTIDFPLSLHYHLDKHLENDLQTVIAHCIRLPNELCPSKCPIRLIFHCFFL